MPRFIKKVNHGFKLSDTEGHTYSKKPMTYKKALAQERAINIRKHGGSDYFQPTGSFQQDLSKVVMSPLLYPAHLLQNFISSHKKGGSHQATYYPEQQAFTNISAGRKSKMINDFGAILDRPAVILPYGFNSRK